MRFIDLTHTSHTRARTGVQRVCRALHHALAESGPVEPVCHDPWLRAWRALNAAERRTLTAPDGAPGKRGARWPLRARLAGSVRRRLRAAPAWPANATGLIVPEIFSPAAGQNLPALFARVRGPRVAIFHDAIALKYPELSPAKTVARFPAYLQELLAFDGIAAVSEDSRQSLVDYWRWLGAPNPPPVAALPLGAEETDGFPAEPVPRPGPPVVLCVGSIEGRKNHAALLDACAQLWDRGGRFELRLLGLAHPQTGRAALAKIAALQAAGRPLRYDGPVDDATLRAAYRECAFTVYPSLLEGFGLPVQESLQQGKPCVCSARGALGESARGGGCLALDRTDAAALADAIGRLLQNPAELAALASAARARVFKSWRAYAAELTAWMDSLPRSPR